MLERLENTPPTVTADQKRGIDDFIQRAGEMLGKQQTELSPYWRWVVTVYGPEILAHFGTFRFLIPELVPLDLIRQRRVGDTD
ncbi:MAG: hypothetical protein KDI48_09735 [Xanthomonadales bacterium]|nr:hypothetical protein [Xanthomonadales bacterium]